jgi:phosphopantetheinyl transferase
MQAIESQNVILYQADLRGQWPEHAARAFAAQLPYARRLALRPGSGAAHASLAGIALAMRALSLLLGRNVRADEIVFADGEKPRLAPPLAFAVGVTRSEDDTVETDFSISHTGPWVACAALAGGSVGLDLEMGADERIADWVMREAALKASGDGLRGLREVSELQLTGGRLEWRGESWHVRRLEGFAGAAACLVTGVEVRALERHAIGLTELFAP